MKEKDHVFLEHAKREWRTKPEYKQMAVHNLFTCLYFYDLCFKIDSVLI